MKTTVRDFNATVASVAFALSRKSVASGLRKLADEFEGENLWPLQVKIEQKADQDEFSETVMSLTFKET